MVEGKEIKRYKNIEIPDDLKKLEYQDFKFDVPPNGAITFKIMFKPGVLPEVFPQARERRTRKAELQGMELQDAKSAADAEEEVHSQYDQPTMAPPASAVEVFPQALEDVQAADEPITDIAVVMSDEVAIITEIIEGEREGQLVFAKVEQETAEVMLEPMAATGEAEAQYEVNKMVMKPAYKGKGKKNVAATKNEGK